MLSEGVHQGWIPDLYQRVREYESTMTPTPMESQLEGASTHTGTHTSASTYDRPI